MKRVMLNTKKNFQVNKYQKMPICFTIYVDFECINVPKEETDDNDAKTIDISRQEAICNG